MNAIVLICLSLLLSPIPALGDSAAKIVIDEWPVPWQGTRPRDPYVGPEGLVWFVGQAGHYVASFDPATDEFARFDLESGTGPHNLIVGDDGMVWYAGNLKAHIGRLDPVSGAIRKYPMPDSRAADPHTLVFDGQGHIWFTVQWGNFVGRLRIADGTVELVEVPTPRARPYGIAVDSGGRPWIVELGSNKLASVDPETLQLEEIPLPREEARPRRLAITSDDQVWYVDYAGGYLGRYDPATGKIEEWPTPSADQSGPYGMVVDNRDRLWFVETGVSPNQFVGFDTKARTYIGSTPIPSGAGSVRHMYFDAKTSDIWFGTDTNNLGRARLSESAEITG